MEKIIWECGFNERGDVTETGRYGIYGPPMTREMAFLVYKIYLMEMM